VSASLFALAPSARHDSKALPPDSKAPATSQNQQKAEEEPEAKIPGISIARSSGGWLGLSIQDNSFQVAFYDAKKKPVAADAARGSARWQPHQKPGNLFCVLNPTGDGKALLGNKPVAPPRLFKVYLSLLNPQGDVTESYVVDYKE
jgi:hypothetical protein